MGLYHRRRRLGAGGAVCMERRSEEGGETTSWSAATCWHSGQRSRGFGSL